MAKRDQDVHFLASKEEVERIHEKMDELGIRSMGAYLRKMALDGYCIRLDLQDVKALVSLLRICSNNLNQYAKRANESGSIYAEDIRDQFKRSGKKPSEFCKINLRMHDVKSYDFVKQYFSNPQLLVKAIKEYRRTANIPKGEYSLSDLLR